MISRLPNMRERIASVAARWREQYPPGDNRLGGSFSTRLGLKTPRSSDDIHTELLALGPDATAGDIAAIIGNDSWTDQNCTSCESVDAVVAVGNRYDEDDTTYLCADCVKQLVALAKR